MNKTTKSPAARRWYHRLVRHLQIYWKGWAWGIGLLLLFVGFVLLMRSAFASTGDEISGWFASIEDPTERGLAYVAAAICAHAVVIAFKAFAHDEIKVKNKE